MRIGEGMLLNNISGLIGFVLNAGKGIPTLDLADRGMGNTVTVEDAARLEGMSLPGGPGDAGKRVRDFFRNGGQGVRTMEHWRGHGVGAGKFHAGPDGGGCGRQRDSFRLFRHYRG